MSMKENWKETGTELGHAFKNLGKTLIKTAAVGVKKAEKWAEGEQNASQQQPSDTPEQPSAPAETEEKN